MPRTTKEYRSRPRTVAVDIFSSDTMRDIDVGNAIAGMFDRVRISRADRHTVQQWYALANVDEDKRDDDAMHEAAMGLWDVLDRYLPDYTHAGSSEYDGALFGVWPSLESLEEDAVSVKDLRDDDTAVRVADLADVPASFVGHVMLVTDHGNVTLYRAQKGRPRFREIWSVV